MGYRGAPVLGLSGIGAWKVSRVLGPGLPSQVKDMAEVCPSSPYEAVHEASQQHGVLGNPGQSRPLGDCHFFFFF